MATKSKSKYHSESKSPSLTPSTSPVRLNLELEVARVSTAATYPNISDQLIIEPPEIQTLIRKLQGFSIFSHRSDKSNSSVTSQYNPAHPLTRLKSEKFGIQPSELPLPTRKRARKAPPESDRETLSSTSSISTPSQRSQPPTSSSQITHPSSTLPLQSSKIIIPSSSQHQGSSSALSLTSGSTMPSLHGTILGRF